jgi:SAM-dependent methyltransferase
MVQSDEYVMAGLETEGEGRRLKLLEAIRDPATVNRLNELGVGSGWRCLEIGAGRGSIARWLADTVGPSGAVVAVDIDTRFLGDMPDNVEVRELDIRSDGVEPGAYDLAHCRALLMHLPDPAGTLARMVEALAPGGLLLAEEGDYGLCYYGGHPDSEEINDQARRVLDQMRERGIVDTTFGRRLPGMLAASGLEVLGVHINTGFSRPGDPGYEFQARNLRDSAPRLRTAGLIDAERAARMKEYFGRPGTFITGPSMVAAWGRKPAH